jgi:hypothetical protein
MDFFMHSSRLIPDAIVCRGTAALRASFCRRPGRRRDVRVALTIGAF